MNSLLAIVTFCLALAALANAQNCILTVPANPLSAVGLATPYTQVGCLMAEGTPSFAQATILDVSRGTFFGYNPLVIDNGTLPASPPTIPILPVNNIVGIWFGTNGRTLVLQDNGQGSLGQGSCVNGITGSNFGKFAHCNAIIFFQVAKQLIDLGRVTVPALGLTLNGQPCPTIRDFTFVDKTPSDGVNTVYLLDPIAKTVAQDTTINRNIIPNSLNLTNNQDNFLLRTLSEAIGCRQWLIQDLADPTQVIATLGTNELQAIFRTSGPLALIPCNHPFAVLDLTGQISLSKVNALRSAVGQNLAFSVNDCSATEFCANFVNVAPARIMLDKNLTFIVDSIDLTVADNLFHFLAGRFTDSFGPAGLNCTGLLNFPNPISLDFDGIRVVDAFISVLRPAPTTLPPILASPVPGSPTPPAAPTVAPTSAPSWDVLNTLGLVTASVNVVNGVMTCRLAAGVNGYIAVAWGGGHGSNSPGVICTVIGSTPICRDINIRGRTGLQTSSAQLVTAVSGSLANGRMLVTFTRPISGITDNINVISNAFFAVSNTPFASTDTTINIFHNAGQGGPLNFAFSSSATGSVPTPPPALVFDDQVSSTLELVSASINLNKAKNEAQFTIKAVCTGYIAIAFGAHDSGSAAIICWLDGNSIAKCSDATIGSRSSTSLAATNQITSVTGALTGGTLSFTFVRSLTGLVTNVNTPAQVFWAISNTIPTITNNAISTYHGPLRGGQNLLFFTSESLTTPITDPVTQAPTITPGGAISVFGPVTTSVTVSGGQMSLSMAVSLTKRQTFGYIALAFGKSHGSPPADGIACWMNTQVVCYEITVGSKSAAGVITGAQITTTSGGSNGGQMIFSFSHSLRFGSTNLDGSQVTTYWSFGANAPVNKQLAIHSQQASTGATMLLSQSTGGSPTTAPIASTSNTILGLSSGVFALMVVVLIVVVVAIIGFFIWKKKQSSNTRGSLPIPSNPLYHPDMQNSPRAY